MKEYEKEKHKPPKMKKSFMLISSFSLYFFANPSNSMLKFHHNNFWNLKSTPTPKLYNSFLE